MTIGLIESVAANAVSALAKRGLIRVRDPDQQKVLRRVFRASITTAVELTLGSEETLYVDHVVGLWGDFLSDPVVVERILERVLGEASAADVLGDGDREWLAETFERRGFDQDTLPVSFVELTDAFAESLWIELRRESQEPGSPIFQARATRMIEEVLLGQTRQEDQSGRLEADVAAVRDEVGRIVTAIEGGESLADRERQLASVPPPVGEALADRLSERWARRLLLNLANRDRSPESTLSYLYGSRLDFLDDAAPISWVVLGEYAAAHERGDIAAELWQSAARMGIDQAGLWLIRSAFAVAQHDNSMAHQLVDEAVSDFELDEAVAEYARAAIEIDIDGVLSTVDRVPAGPAWLDAMLMSGRAEALVAVGQIDDAISTLEGAVRRHPDSAGLLIRLSGLVGARAVNKATGSREADLRRAEELALVARDKRRRWRGPSAPAVAAAASAALARGDASRVIELTSAGDDSLALPSEASTDEVLIERIHASLAIGETETAADLAGMIRDPILRLEFDAALADAGGDAASATEGYLAALSEATSLDQRVRIQMSLAFLRVWPIPGLDETRKEADDEVADSIEAISASSRGDTQRAVRVLRKWRDSHPRSAAMLGDVYAQGGEIDFAVAEYRRLHERFGDPGARARAALLLYSDGQTDEAKAEAQIALGFVDVGSHEWFQLNRLLADAAWQSHEWALAERHIRQLVEQGEADPNTVWGLVAVLFNQRKLDVAWADYLALGKPDPRTADEIRLWSHLAGRFDPGAEVVRRLAEYVSEAIDSGDEELASALLGASYTLGSGVELGPETAQLRQSATDDFVARFPESRFFFRLQWSSVEDLSEALRPRMEPGARAFTDLVRQVYRTQMPVGMLSAASGRTYVEALLVRAGLVLPLETPSEGLRAAEEADVAAALNGPIVVDPSVLATASLFPTTWEVVRAEFSELLVVEAAAVDIHQAADAFALESPGAIGWDSVSQSITFHETDVTEAERRAERSQWIATETIDRTRVVPFAGPELFPDLDLDRYGPWLAALEYAAKNSVPVMADDIALRHLCRSQGIVTFGSTAAFRVLGERGLLTAEELSEVESALRASYAVDLDFDPDDVFKLAESEGWEPRAAAIALTRTAVWRADSERVIDTFVRIMGRVAEHDPQLLPLWLASAVMGAASGLLAQHAADVAGRMLASAIHDFARAEPDVIRSMVHAARSACIELGLHKTLDPLSNAARILHEIYVKRFGPGRGNIEVRKLLSALTPEDQFKAITVLGQN